MRNIFEIKNVNFSVDGIEKVKNVSFSIENEGDIICLLGPSGIGKTTILRTIAGLEKINKGEIFLKGQLISSKDNHIEPENRNISLAFQDNCLFPHYTVEKNIQIAVNRNRNKTKKIIPDFIIKLLNLNNVLKKFPHQISAGEAQRVSLARSLLFEPADSITELALEDQIRRVLVNHEPRIKVLNVTVNDNSDENAYDVTLKYLIKRIQREAEVEIILRRLR